jgi:hypothetical protein
MSKTQGPLSSERVPISFTATVAASTTVTLPYKVYSESMLQDLIFNFALNQQRLLQVYVYTGPFGTAQDDPIFDTPTGYNYPFLVGDNNQVVFRALNREIQAGEFLTVVAINTDAANPHTLDIQATLRRMEGPP